MRRSFKITWNLEIIDQGISFQFTIMDKKKLVSISISIVPMCHLGAFLMEENDISMILPRVCTIINKLFRGMFKVFLSMWLTCSHTYFMYTLESIANSCRQSNKSRALGIGYVFMWYLYIVNIIRVKLYCNQGEIVVETVGIPSNRAYTLYVINTLQCTVKTFLV